MFSIFHTSYCGSTLLACLLSKSAPTLTEPDWSHEIRFVENMQDKLNLVNNNYQNNTIVKYSSLVCEIAPNISGKKVFLYRNFQDHLNKLNPLNPKEEALFWCKRFAHLSMADNVLFLETNYFLNNQQKAAQEVCNYFEIEYKPVYINFHVKEAGYNHRNEPIII